MIDTQLLRLRHEILNVPLETIAEEIKVPLSILEKEARGWQQWWPDSLFSISSSSSGLTVTPNQEVDYYEDESDLSPLEEGADLYMKEYRIRLQVYTLAKEVYFAHRYASIEAALLDQIGNMAPVAVAPQDVKHLVASLKDLPSKVASAAGIKLGMSDDGIPTLIVKDLSGRVTT